MFGYTTSVVSSEPLHLDVIRNVPPARSGIIGSFLTKGRAAKENDTTRILFRKVNLHCEVRMQVRRRYIPCFGALHRGDFSLSSSRAHKHTNSPHRVQLQFTADERNC